MKKYITSIVLVVCFHFFMIAQSGKNFIDQNYIEITGTAETLVTPNKIYEDTSIIENPSFQKISITATVLTKFELKTKKE